MYRLWTSSRAEKGLRSLLALLFLYASVDKLLHPADFAAIIRDYRILPEALVNLVAVVLPWVELLLGILLLSGVWLEAALLLANLLLLTFWGALVFNYARGIDVSCGCFSTSREQGGAMGWYVLRDALFVLLGLAAAVLGWKRTARATTMRAAHE